jgi:hypothetical protein
MLASPVQRVIIAVAMPVAALLAGCATTEEQPPSLTPAQGRALVARLVPADIADRARWANDLYAAIAALEIPVTPQTVCSAIAIIEQESGFRADPAVPGLPAIARREMERRREQAGMPKLVLDAALALPSSNGQHYGDRLDAVKTERQLSELYEDFIGRIPLGRALLADRNPVRTGGPMQVSIAFAEAHAAARPYPYPVDRSIRHEVFTRRGGLYFGVAHLLDYPAGYDRPIYRFADFNAGRYASRNAAFQNAVTQASGIPLAQDGDLLRLDHGRLAAEPGSTERAVRVLARRLDLDDASIRRELATGETREFESTRVYQRVFALADRLAGRPLPRAAIPQIPLDSPKLTRKLTTEWFASRVDMRYRSCLGRA